MSIKSVKSSVTLLNMGPELESMKNSCMCHHVAEYYPSRSYEDDIINPICKNVDSRKIPENTKNVRFFYIYILMCVCSLCAHLYMGVHAYTCTEARTDHGKSSSTSLCLFL